MRTQSMAAAFLAFLVLGSATAADARSVTYNLDIPAQDLNAALQQLALASQHRLFYRSELVRGKTSSALKGEFTTEQALEALLDGTNLRYDITSSAVVLIRGERSSPISSGASHFPAGSDERAEDDRRGLPSTFRLAFAQGEENRNSTAGEQNNSPSSGEEAAELQEIIVTAARVSESLQKTALAIQAVSAEDIIKQGAVTPEEVGKLVPSMNITTGGLTTIYLRGLGANASGGFGQNSLAFNVDGVVLSQQGAMNGNFFDLERIEVLKGPQGTLYGRNASSGAINVITRNPSRELGGNFNVEVGNYSLARVSGALNVPLSDTFAVRGALYAGERDGYMSDGSDDDDQLNGRLKALWVPNDSLRALLAYSETNVHIRGSIAGSQTPRPAVNGDPRLGPTEPQVSSLLVAFGAPPPNPKVHTDLVNHLAYATVDWDVGFGTLTYIPAYGWSRQCLGCEAAVVPYPAQALLGTHIDSDQLSNELRLAHVGDRFKYVAGAYQFSEHIEMDNLYYVSQAAGSSTNHVSKLDTDSYAAFAEATVSLSPAFRLIGGLRYTRDEKELAGTTLQAGPAQRFFGLGPDPVGIGDGIGPGITTGVHQWQMDNSGDFSRTNWKVGVEYDASPASFLFATAGTGYKGGIFYSGPPPGNLVEPEYMTAYTVGSKNRFLNNSLQINAEIFYWSFENQQVSGIGVDSGGSLNYVTYNAGESTIYGTNLDVQWQMTPRDLFRANVEYNHAYYDEYFIPSPLPFSPGAVGGGCPVATTPGGLFGVTFTADCSDQHMVFAPDWSGNVAYGHDFTVGAGNTLHAEVGARFNSKQYIQQDWSSELSRMPAYVVWDALLEYTFADRPVSVALWGRNLGDKVVYASADGGSVFGLILATAQAPRAYGLRFNVTF